MKKYSIKPNKNQIQIMRLFWKMLKREELIFINKICDLERTMIDKTGIQELEFFRADGEYVGIGNMSRTMKLISDTDLDKN